MCSFQGWAFRRIALGLFAAAAAILAALLLRGGAALPTAAGGGAVIVIDAGHGGPDGGAVGAGGVEEAGLNLAVSRLLESELMGRGFTTVMTREDGDALGRTKSADMAARRDIMNAPGTAAVVSIHMNEFGDCSVSGPMVFYMKGSAEGERLAGCIISAVTEAIGAPPRPANPGDYYVIRESSAPAVIVECGFLSNSRDLELLQQPRHQRLIAEGIAAGVEAYFEQAGSSPPPA